MTDIAIPDSGADNTPAQAAAQAAPEPVSALILWANEARQAAGIASSLARTSFVPASLRGKPEDITAAILAGQELGLRPMATLRSMDVIQGTPALRAHAMRGLVQSHGHEVELVESAPERCVMRGRRKGAERWQEVVWTLGRAKELGLLGKDQWKKQPQTMLIARATGEICRLVAADVLFAMPYAAEELYESSSRSVDVVVDRPRVTLEEITGARPEPAAVASVAPSASAEPASPWAEDQSSADGSAEEELPESYEPASWSAVAQPGGAA